jgi:hypothetical protein
MFGAGKKVLADENCLGQFVMVEILSQRLVLNQDELGKANCQFAARICAAS